MAGLGPPAPGDPARIGPYRLAGRLGQGGWGTVYGALDGAGHRAAVEVLAPAFAADPGAREAFAHRAAALHGAGGVCAPEVVAADPAADPPWIATAHAPGPDLESYLRAHGPLGPDALLAFAAATAEAVARMHAVGVVHGDLRPSRVVLSPGGPRPEGTGAPRPGADESADVAAWGALVAAAGTGRSPYGPDGSPDLEGVPASLRPMLSAAMDARPLARPEAEAIYRGLVDFAVDEDIRSVPTEDLEGLLRALLSRVWADVARTAAGWPDGDWDAAAAPQEAAAGASGADPSGSGASAPPAAMGSIPGGKLAAVVAAAVLGTTAVGVGGLYTAGTVAGGSPAPSPSPSASPAPELGSAEEVVDGIVALVEETGSYRVQEEVDDGGPEPRRSELVFRADPDVFLLIEEGEPGTETMWLPGSGAGKQRRVYSDPALNQGLTDHYVRVRVEGTPRAERLDRDAVAAPFTELAESMEVEERADEQVDGAAATRFTGTFTAAAPEAAAAPEGEAENGFSLWVAQDGRPLRLEYGTDPEDPAVTLEYSGFDGELDTWLCGTVSGVPRVGEAMLVGTSEEVSCASARAATETYLDMPDEEKVGTGYVVEDIDGWYCGLQPTASVDIRRDSEDAGSCGLDYPALVQRADFIRLD
ncbi:serine/threonine-protein kinase [Nocardiopsis suaedae]|uniref:Protein kinase domain-containing protein n=1 Tax=Nocardiopsis suaedae TaxID=3018444 RepID=A0ABT4TS53_9ACTN|nr:hypothetical protein [Nocardiopsis suaedae]MDA2807508.1 hypothetical protein [Nocardiopsis suaedae]